MANMLAERIKNVTLTKSQRKIADYFIQNQDRIGGLSLQEAAAETGVSDASIIRFARAIGFKGYADLKDSAYDMLVKNAASGMSLAERMTSNKEKYQTDNTELQFRELIQQNVLSVFHDNKPEDFETAVDCLVGAKSKYVIGLRGCKGVAFQFGRLLSFMTPGVMVITDDDCNSINSMQDASGEDTVIMFVFSRFYYIDLNYMKMARKRGCKVIMVVNDATGPLSAYADVILMVVAANLSFFNSAIGADVVAEYLLNLISEKVDFKDRMAERDAMTEDQRL